MQISHLRECQVGQGIFPTLACHDTGGIIISNQEVFELNILPPAGLLLKGKMIELG